MKFTATCLLGLGLLSACQSKKTEQAATAVTRPDTTIVVDDDTLESSDKAIDPTRIAVATLPDSADATTEATETNFYIIPGKQVGMITPTATETSLRQLVGKNNITHEPVSSGEGDSEPGTTLFKGTANEVHILWKDKNRFANPKTVLIQPTPDETTAKNVVPNWRINNGLKIGATLKDVERINGKPFKLYGFGGDGGGALTDAQGGKLAVADGTDLSLTFGTGTLTPARQKLAETVMGNREFISSLPVLQQLNPTVEIIRVRFR